MPYIKRIRVSQINPTLRQRAVALIDILQMAYPAVFPTKPNPKVPLSIGIFSDLHKVKPPNVSTKLLIAALALWCSGIRYWEALQPGAPRYALDGTIRGEVNEVQAEKAQRALKNRLEWLERKRTAKGDCSSFPQKED